MPSLFTFLTQYALQAPQLLIWLVGIALAIVWWQRAPKIALVTCGAGGTAISVGLPSMLIDNGQSATQVGTASALRSLLHTALWAAVLFAIFSGRTGGISKVAISL